MLTLTFPLLALPLLWTILPATSLSVQSGSKSQDPTLSAGGPSKGAGEAEAGVRGADPRPGGAQAPGSDHDPEVRGWPR